MALKVAPEFSFKYKAELSTKIPQKNTSESNGFCGKSQVNHKKREGKCKTLYIKSKTFCIAPA